MSTKIVCKIGPGFGVAFEYFEFWINLPVPQDPLWSVTIGWLASSVSYICCFRQQVNVQKTECAVAFTDRNFVDNFLKVVIYLALVANI